MILIDAAKIRCMDTPKNLFNNPKSKLVASFFGEFNTINNSFVYAHQLKICKQSNIKATVIKSYYKGSFYLIEALYNKQTIFFEHNTALKNELVVYLKITE